jgi:hypothetical protein
MACAGPFGNIINHRWLEALRYERSLKQPAMLRYLWKCPGPKDLIPTAWAFNI